MACRTIRNERERRTTAMLTPFMPCGAKIPVIALFAGAFFSNAAWVSATMYLVGIVLNFPRCSSGEENHRTEVPEILFHHRASGI